MSMPSGKQQESGRLARAVSAELRAVMARKRISGAQLADAADMSQSYLSRRLRDKVPFTLNDMEPLCSALGEDLESMMESAFKAMIDSDD